MEWFSAWTICEWFAGTTKRAPDDAKMWNHTSPIITFANRKTCSMKVQMVSFELRTSYDNSASADSFNTPWKALFKNLKRHEHGVLRYDFYLVDSDSISLFRFYEIQGSVQELPKGNSVWCHQRRQVSQWAYLNVLVSDSTCTKIYPYCGKRS